MLNVQAWKGINENKRDFHDAHIFCKPKQLQFDKVKANFF